MLYVVTAIFGAIRDTLQSIPTFPGVKCIAYSDKDSAPSGWELRKPEWTHGDSRRTARYHKIMCHKILPEAASWLWLDGSLTLQKSPAVFFSAFPDSDIVYFKHAERKCVYAEYRACVRLRKDDPEKMRLQMGKYRMANYPDNAGLAETGVLFRRNCPDVISFNTNWWYEIENGSCRDQLSFPFVLNQTWPRLRTDSPSGTVYDNTLTKFTPHR